MRYVAKRTKQNKLPGGSGRETMRLCINQFARLRILEEGLTQTDFKMLFKLGKRNIYFLYYFVFL